MATILINSKDPSLKTDIVKGEMTFHHAAKYNPDTDSYEEKIYGRLSMRKYIEEINSIETDRFILNGVIVVDECAATADYNINYTFEAESLEVLNDPFTQNEIQTIEDKIYAYEKKDKILYVNGESFYYYDDDNETSKGVNITE